MTENEKREAFRLMVLEWIARNDSTAYIKHLSRPAGVHHPLKVHEFPDDDLVAIARHLPSSALFVRIDGTLPVDDLVDRLMGLVVDDDG